MDDLQVDPVDEIAMEIGLDLIDFCIGQLEDESMAEEGLDGSELYEIEVSCKMIVKNILTHQIYTHYAPAPWGQIGQHHQQTK